MQGATAGEDLRTIGLWVDDQPELLQRFEVRHCVLGEQDPLFGQRGDQGFDSFDITGPGPSQVQASGEFVFGVVVRGDPSVIEGACISAHTDIQHHHQGRTRKSPGSRLLPTPRTLNCHPRR